MPSPYDMYRAPIDKRGCRNWESAVRYCPSDVEVATIADGYGMEAALELGSPRAGHSIKRRSGDERLFEGLPCQFSRHIDFKILGLRRDRKRVRALLHWPAAADETRSHNTPAMTTERPQRP